MEMGGNFCQLLELGGTTIKGRRVIQQFEIVFAHPETQLIGIYVIRQHYQLPCIIFCRLIKWWPLKNWLPNST